MDRVLSTQHMRGGTPPPTLPRLVSDSELLDRVAGIRVWRFGRVGDLVSDPLHGETKGKKVGT